MRIPSTNRDGDVMPRPYASEVLLSTVENNFLSISRPKMYFSGSVYSVLHNQYEIGDKLDTADNDVVSKGYTYNNI